MKQNRSISRKKTALSILSILLLLFASLLFLKAYLSEKPFELNNSIDYKANELKKLETAAIQGVNFKKESLSPATEFGKTIATPYPPTDLSKNLYLKVTTLNEQVIVTLNNKDEVTIIHNLPLDAKQVDFYDDESVSYVRKDLDFGYDILFTKKPFQNPRRLFELNPGQKLSSKFFMPAEQTFYILIQDINNTSLIYSYANGQLTELYESNYLESSMQIISKVKDKLFFKKAKNCYVLDLYIKQLEETKCEFSNVNAEGINFVKKTNEITKYVTSNESFARALELDSLKFYESFLFNNNKLVFVEIDIKDLKKRKLRVVDLSTPNITTTVYTDLPFSNYSKFFPFNGTYYFSSPNLADNKWERLLKIAPAPSSYPLSYKDPKEDFKEIDLPGLKPIDIQIIYPEYFLN